MKKRTRGKNYALTLRWSAGHAGISGNELADKEAKRAATGNTSDKKLLPTYLRRPLLINPSAVTQHINTEIKQRWNRKWKQSARGRRLAKLGLSAPSPSYIRTISKANISRRSASLVTQALLKHIPLNEYLYKIKAVDNAKCPACGAVSESVRHFLMECPIYAHERWIMERGLRKANKVLMLRNLIRDAEALDLLVDYISVTHHFSTNI